MEREQFSSPENENPLTLEGREDWELAGQRLGELRQRHEEGANNENETIEDED